MTTTIIQTAVLALLASAILTPLCMRIAHPLGLLSSPRLFGASSRRIPSTGGFAVAVGTAFAFGLPWGLSVGMGSVVVGSVLALALGLTDDLWKSFAARPWYRLALQVAIAYGAWVVGLRADQAGVLGLVLTVVFLVGCMNAFNLLDNMDGVAATTAAATAAGIAVAATVGGQFIVASLAAGLCGACLGFLPYNINRARAYLGNGGSLLLGFLIGGTALKLRLPIGQAWSVFAVVGLVGVAALDTSLVVVSRLVHGKSVMDGGTDHVSHRLVKLGLSTWQAALVHGVAAGAAAVMIAIGVAAEIHALILIPLVLLTLGGLALLGVKVYEGGSVTLSHT